MLRLSGCALLFSKVRDPRLPMLEEWPPEEPPARASASAGASATLAQTNSARRMRQFINRLDIALPAQKILKRTQPSINMGCRRTGKTPAHRNIVGDRLNKPPGDAEGKSCAIRTHVRLIAEALVPKYFVITHDASGCWNRVRLAALAH